MDLSDAVVALEALAHYGRLSVFELLAKAGQHGMAAGDIALKLRTAPNVMSGQLLGLSRVGLIRARREGRHLIYAADSDRMNALLIFLATCNQAGVEGGGEFRNAREADGPHRI